MTWSTPLTAVSNAALTAAQWNASVRDNLLETAVAKATTAGYIFAATGTNSVAQRAVISDSISTSETSASTTYTDLATVGPQVTITTGPLALLLDAAYQSNSSTSTSFYAWTISGASSVAAADGSSLRFQSGAVNQASRSADVRRLTGLTPGSQTITSKYRVSGGTTTWADRHLCIIGL